MTEIALRRGRMLLTQTSTFLAESRLLSWRWALFLFAAAVVSAPGEIGEAARGALADAFLAVTVFVAGTLALVHIAERRTGIDFTALLSRGGIARVPVGALLGAFPGCGGAIIVATNYVSGKASLGSLVATLTATMGDAAFLLMAREPTTALMIIVGSFILGTITGWIVDRIHPNGLGDNAQTDAAVSAASASSSPAPMSNTSSWLWMAFVVPGGILGVLLAFQVEPGQWVAGGDWMTEALGVGGALLALAFWASRRRSGPIRGATFDADDSTASTRIIDDTNFVTAWVVMGFLAYELTMVIGGFDLGALFATYGIFLPLIGMLVGLIPGCGPPLVITTLYLNGVIPPSALVANALSNDGDALFPSIALAPKAAVVASAYTMVPALVAGYAVYFTIG